MDTVFWMDLHASAAGSLEAKFRKLLSNAGLGTIITKGALTALKVHVGENGNLAYLNHNYARLTAELVKKCGGKPFLTDTNTLYSGGRHNAVDHNLTAVMHGYFSGTTEAPFIVADGLRGLDFEELPVDGTHVTTARIGSALARADAIVMLSHFKGHGELGFGGTLKNMGMGCAAVPGKLILHSSSKPLSSKEKCVGCLQCFRACPVGAIVMKDKKASINYDLCIGCGQCVAACNYGAMNVQWESGGETLIEKVGEYAAALHRRFVGKSLYINFAMNISPDCDCWNYNDVPVVQDIGIFASTNPLAVDSATLDAVNKSPRIEQSAFAAEKSVNGNIFDGIRKGIRSAYIFDYCKKLGMAGEYRLEKI